MIDTEGLLTEKGLRYARYVATAYKWSTYLPAVVTRYAHGFSCALCFQIILTEGAKENDRRKQAKMSRMRNGASIDRREDAGQMPETGV